MRTLILVLVAFLVWGIMTVSHAQDIPVIDLTHTGNYSSEQPPSIAADASSTIPAWAQGSTFQKPPESFDQKPEGVHRLRIFLRELSILQQAARSIGGDIRVTITPVGITAEDLVVPLTQMGCFDIHPQGDMIVVESKKDQTQIAAFHEEIAQLERRRRYLLNDIQILEKLAAQKQSPAASQVATWQDAPVENPRIAATQPAFSVSVIPASQASGNSEISRNQIVEKQASIHGPGSSPIPLRGNSIFTSSKSAASSGIDTKEMDSGIVNTIVQPHGSETEIVYPNSEAGSSSDMQPREVPSTPLNLSSVQTSSISP